MLSIFNSSVKKLSNLDSSFLITDTSWKKNLLKYQPKCLEWWETFQKLFFKLNHFSLFQIKSKCSSSQEKQDRGKGSGLTSKGLAKLLPRIQNLYQITYILCNIVLSIWNQPFGTKWLAPRGTLGLQCIRRAQLLIHTTHLHCSVPWNYVTSLLAYWRG